jgi:hypothetical protein
VLSRFFSLFLTVRSLPRSREVVALLTDDCLWYSSVNDPLHLLVTIPLTREPVSYPDSDSACTFTVPGPPNCQTQFRAKNRLELNTWIDTINSRAVLCSENDVIFMAEEMCSLGESRNSCRDIDFLSECASFEGTLRNRRDNPSSPLRPSHLFQLSPRDVSQLLDVQFRTGVSALLGVCRGLPPRAPALAPASHCNAHLFLFCRCDVPSAGPRYGSVSSSMGSGDLQLLHR